MPRLPTLARGRLQPSLDLFDLSAQRGYTFVGFIRQAHLERKLASSGTCQLIVSGSGPGPYTVGLTLS